MSNRIILQVNNKKRDFPSDVFLLLLPDVQHERVQIINSFWPVTNNFFFNFDCFFSTQVWVYIFVLAITHLRSLRVPLPLQHQTIVSGNKKQHLFMCYKKKTLFLIHNTWTFISLLHNVIFFFLLIF